MKNRGFVNIIIITLIALALLKYFLNWDVFDAANSEQGKSTILYVRDIVNLIWSYISAPVIFIWERIVWPLLSLAWDSLNHFIKWGREVNGTT